MGKAKATVYGGASVSLLATSRPDDPPAILVDPKLATERLMATTHAVGRTFAGLQADLRPLDQSTLDGEQQRLLQVGRQWTDGWVGQQVATHALTIVRTVSAFVESYEAAQEVLQEIRPQLEASREHIETRKTGLMIATEVERLAAYEDAVMKTQRAYGELEQSLARAATWLPVAKASALRTAEAAGRVILRVRVDTITAEQRALQSRLAVLRSGSHSTLDEVAIAVREAEQMNETHIRLPELTWPDDDLFAPPRLREWGTE